MPTPSNSQAAAIIHNDVDAPNSAHSQIGDTATSCVFPPRLDAAFFANSIGCPLLCGFEGILDRRKRGELLIVEFESASDVPTATAERPSQPGRRQISARTQATKSIDSSYLRMLHHLGD
jgi:hypothetical protein